MTAVNVFLFTDRIIIWSDGATYDADGRLYRRSSKVGFLPHLNAAVMVRGPSLAVPLLTQQLGQSECFDAMVNALAATVENAVLRHRHVWELNSGGKDFEVIVTGWSDARCGPESYRIKSTHPDDVMALGPVFLTPSDDRLVEKMQAEFPGADDAILGELDVGLRVLELQRELKFVPGNGSGEIRGVGAFAQLTIVERGRIQTSIVKRWPDRVGELIGRDIPEIERPKAPGQRSENDPS